MLTEREPSSAVVMVTERENPIAVKVDGETAMRPPQIKVS
jgi:hypothetical protein